MSIVEPPETEADSPSRPPIRRPGLFYGCVILSFGLLGGAVIALTLT